VDHLGEAHRRQPDRVGEGDTVVGSAVTASTVAPAAADSDHGPAVLVDHLQDVAERFVEYHRMPSKSEHVFELKVAGATDTPMSEQVGSG
jgi:hypothetical protein